MYNTLPYSLKDCIRQAENAGNFIYDPRENRNILLEKAPFPFTQQIKYLLAFLIPWFNELSASHPLISTCVSKKPFDKGKQGAQGKCFMHS
jgi:hypothetical protein